MSWPFTIREKTHHTAVTDAATELTHTHTHTQTHKLLCSREGRRMTKTPTRIQRRLNAVKNEALFLCIKNMGSNSLVPHFAISVNLLKNYKSYCSTVHFYRITLVYQPTNAHIISYNTFKTL